MLMGFQMNHPTNRYRHLRVDIYIREEANYVYNIFSSVDKMLILFTQPEMNGPVNHHLIV